MPDITMCINKECQLRVACYRYRAIPSDKQSYAFYIPHENDCDHVLPIFDYTESILPMKDIPLERA